MQEQDAADNPEGATAREGAGCASEAAFGDDKGGSQAHIVAEIAGCSDSANSKCRGEVSGIA